MRSPGFEYIRNGRAMAQALIRQQRAVRRAQPAMFVAGPERVEEHVAPDGTTATVRVRSPASAQSTPGERLMRRYTGDDREVNRGR